MSHSIEQGHHFHLARRFVKLIAPEFRVFATDQLETDQCVLDLKAKTIEVSEDSSELQAVAGILFQLGHIRLRERKELSEHFGHIKDIGEARLVSRLVKQGVVADKLASDWAYNVFISNWSVDEKVAKSMVSRYVWKDTDWQSYYTSA